LYASASGRLYLAKIQEWYANIDLDRYSGFSLSRPYRKGCCRARGVEAVQLEWRVGESRVYNNQRR